MEAGSTSPMKEEGSVDANWLKSRAVYYLRTLCEQISDRRLGSAGNRMATAFFAEVLQGLGFKTAFQEFACLDWVDGGATLTTGDTVFEVLSSPYSQGCEARGPLRVAQSLAELTQLSAEDCILLIKGGLAREQLMPKKFTFYNPEHHQEIYRQIERSQPLAIVTATSRNPELAGGMYPFPMIEDGDFDIPSAYMKDVEGERLAAFAGQEVALRIDASRTPAIGHNVSCLIGPREGRRLVFCAHIDAKDDTQGALDNATGVVMLLLLAELLASYQGQMPVEILALNGEDHYSAQGQKEYIRANEGRFDQILLAINTDVAGYREGKSVFSMYNCSEEVEQAIRSTLAGFGSLKEGEAWYQSDHSIFIQQGCAAVAITSEHFMELSSNITHTPKDNLDLVSVEKIVDVACALRAVVEELERLISAG